jgi:hypothetical protein
MASPGEKNVSAYIEPKVANAFSEQIEKRGYLKRKAIEGALKAFIEIPPEAQVALMSHLMPLLFLRSDVQLALDYRGYTTPKVGIKAHAFPAGS